MAATSHPSVTKVPVWKVAKESYRSVFGRPIIFIKLAWFPALLYFALAGSLFYLFFRSVEALQPFPANEFPRASRWFNVLSLGTSILLIGLISIFAVRWHRFRLRSEVVGGTAHLFTREWQRFTTYALLIYSPNLLLGLLSMVEFVPRLRLPRGVELLLSGVLSLALFSILIYALACSLIFPSAAYGEPLTWRHARQRLKGNFWRLVACCVIVSVLAFFTCLPAIFLLMMPIPATGTYAPLGMTAIMTIFEMIFVALFASILSAFYKRIVLAVETSG